MTGSAVNIRQGPEPVAGGAEDAEGAETVFNAEGSGPAEFFPDLLWEALRVLRVLGALIVSAVSRPLCAGPRGERDGNRNRLRVDLRALQLAAEIHVDRLPLREHVKGRGSRLTMAAGEQKSPLPAFRSRRIASPCRAETR